MIVRYKLPELIKKKVSEAGTCSHVSNMTGGCTCLIYYQEVVSADKGSVIGGEPALPQSCFKHDYGGESTPALPQPCFEHDGRMYLSDILSGSC